MEEEKKQSDEVPTTESNNENEAQTVRAKAILELVQLSDEEQKQADEQAKAEAEAVQSNDAAVKKERLSLMKFNMQFRNMKGLQSQQRASHAYEGKCPIS